MIMGKLTTAIRAFFNKIANALWESDPHAILQLEVDQATEQIQVARLGLERYRGLVERVSMQVAAEKQNVQRLESQIRAHLQAGNREVAGQLAIQLQQVKTELASNEQQLTMHTESYNNNLLKLRVALPGGRVDFSACRTGSRLACTARAFAASPLKASSVYSCMRRSAADCSRKGGVEHR